MQAFKQIMPKPLFPPTGNRGFSLIEVIIVVALIGTVFVMVIPNIGMIGKSEAASKMAALSGDIRSAFDMAVLNQKPYRMVFEFNSGNYWLESTESKHFVISSEKKERELTADELEEEKEIFEDSFLEYQELAGKEVEIADEEKTVPPSSPLLLAKAKLMPATWSKVADIEWQGRSLGPYFVVQDMQTEHHSQLVRLSDHLEQAKAYLYFFPQGYVERAVIHVASKLADFEVDNSEPPYTVTTKPYEGVAEIETGYIEVDIFEKERR